MEYTMEDAFETVKENVMERQQEIENLMDTVSNNDPVALNNSCNSEDVRRKQHQLCKILSNHVRREELKDYPFPGTSDLHIQVLSELEEEVKNAQQLLDKMKIQLSDIKEDVSRLENKKTGLEKMKETYLDVTEMMANTTYNKEYVTTKRIHKTVKNDLHNVVENLFPENNDFKNLLYELTSAYTKGGDDLYLDVTPEVLDFINFLIEAGIVGYHRNDKSKVKLMEML